MTGSFGVGNRDFGIRSNAPGALLDDLNASVNFSRTESMRTWLYLSHILSVTWPAMRFAVTLSIPPSAIFVMH